MRGYAIVHDKLRHRDRDVKYGKVTVISSGPHSQPRQRSALARASPGREPPGERHLTGHKAPTWHPSLLFNRLGPHQLRSQAPKTFPKRCREEPDA